MPTCTPQLCFGNNAPSHESEPDYGSYSLNPGSIEVGEITIINGVIMRGRALRRGRYTRIRPWEQYEYDNPEVLIVHNRGSFNQIQPTISEFQPFETSQILAQINEQIAGDHPEDVQEDIKNEIINRLIKFINSDEARKQIQKQINQNVYVFNVKPDDPNLTPFSSGVGVYKAIMGGQVRFSVRDDDRSREYWRTPYFKLNQKYKIKIQLSSIDFCKKIDDQFALDQTTLNLDPKWQNILIGSPSTEICDSIQMQVIAENIYVTQIADSWFMTPEQAAEYSNSLVSNSGPQNLVGQGFGPLVNPSSALSLFQAMADQGKQNELMYGFLGNVIGIATKYFSLDGPLIQGTWVIPLTADLNGRQVLAALLKPHFTIGLNEARQLVTNPYGYFQTIQNSLIAAGFGPTIPGYDNINNDIQNKGIPTQEQSSTNIDLNGMFTTSNQQSRETGGGPVQNAINNNVIIVDPNGLLNNLRSQGRQVK